MERIKVKKNENTESFIKTDCFAYQGQKKGCKGLNKLYCRTHRCTFYKNKEQYDKEIEMVLNRLEKINYKGNMDFYDELEG